MNIIDNLLTINPYSRSGKKISHVENIVVHYVGNSNTSASSNRNYFESLKDKKNIYASSHYIIGLDGEIIRCVPDNEVAYHAKQANNHSIGIECCHNDDGGKFNGKTYNSLIDLLAELCEQYNLDPKQDILRHYDVTGKKCPLYYANNVQEWNKIKSDTVTRLNTKSVPQWQIDALKDACNRFNLDVEYWMQRSGEPLTVAQFYSIINKICK